MFGNSPFTAPPSATIPQDCDIVFVADIFLEDYTGGAELTTEALIKSCPLKVYKIKSKDLTLELLEQGHAKYWVFGNFSNLNHELIPSIAANMAYSVLEYDYKYCRYRSPEKHQAIENIVCDCQTQLSGKLVSAFLYAAQSIWWMSEAQMVHYHELFPFLDEKSNTVLSSVFDDRFFITLKLLRERYKNHDRKGWVVLGSASWIKGAEQAEEWCKKNNKDYEVLWNLPYEDVLEKLAQAEGFVYLPQGGDTCPRMVIEAKLLGCKLHINNDVQHAKEIWFDTDDQFDTEAYLYAARERFWNGIKNSMHFTPTLSGYTTTHNCIQHNYPWQQSIRSMLGFCDEVVVVDGGSTDGTWEALVSWAEEEEKLKIHKIERDWTDLRFAVFDGAQKAEARNRCTGGFCWQQDADEVVHEDDYAKIKYMLFSFPPEADLISLPVIEYWGSAHKVRMDVNPWKWRVSRNKPYITHGIPAQLRQYDDNHQLYAQLGTDGCDYIHKETGYVIPHATFYTDEIHKGRLLALKEGRQSTILQQYEEWFNRTVEMLPSIHHYSWFDLERKIKTYRDYWSSHWQSLYNIVQEDTAENNMFFDKRWADVTDEDIKKLAIELSEKTGGHIFHNKIDFTHPTPFIEVKRNQPQLMLK